MSRSTALLAECREQAVSGVRHPRPERLAGVVGDEIHQHVDVADREILGPGTDAATPSTPPREVSNRQRRPTYLIKAALDPQEERRGGAVLWRREGHLQVCRLRPRDMPEPVSAIVPFVCTRLVPCWVAGDYVLVSITLSSTSTSATCPVSAPCSATAPLAMIHLGWFRG